MEMYILPQVKQKTSGNLLYDAGNPNLVLGDNLEGLGRCGRYKREQVYVLLWLTHADAWQEPTQGCKRIILQLRIKHHLQNPKYLNTSLSESKGLMFPNCHALSLKQESQALT